MYSLIVFLPFLGAVLTGFFGYRLGHKGSSIVTICCIFISLILSVSVFFDVLIKNVVFYIKIFSLLQ